AACPWFGDFTFLRVLAKNPILFLDVRPEGQAADEAVEETVDELPFSFDSVCRPARAATRALSSKRLGPIVGGVYEKSGPVGQPPASLGPLSSDSSSTAYVMTRASGRVRPSDHAASNVTAPSRARVAATSRSWSMRSAGAMCIPRESRRASAAANSRGPCCLSLRTGPARQALQAGDEASLVLQLLRQ